MPGASERLARDFNKILDLALEDGNLRRNASTLKLCRVDSSGRKELWACLRFPSYERLVLFHCAFLALRSQDTGSPTYVEDHEIHGEKSIYAGKIIDDNYEHALRVFRDRDSGGIRLQASVLRGEMKRWALVTMIRGISLTSSQNPDASEFMDSIYDLAGK
ncbi:MAG: hypothetical protein Q9211_003903 [Gyalolechia sp. 1 TL-2023]